MSRVQTITVGPGDGDQRLDRWLKRMFPHVAQGRIEKMCRKGELRVDGARVKASTRIDVGDTLVLYSDGMVENAAADDGLAVGAERFQRVLVDRLDRHDPDDASVARSMVEDLLTITGPELRDDATVLLVSRRP